MALLHLPAEQRPWHAVVLPNASEYLPASHVVHCASLVSPVVALHFPFVQVSLHWFADERLVALLYFPAAHLSHSRELAEELPHLPAIHGPHAAPATPSIELSYWGHNTQSPAAVDPNDETYRPI